MDGRSLLTLVDQTARAAGLGAALKRVTPQGENRLGVQFDAVEFDQLHLAGPIGTRLSHLDCQFERGPHRHWPGERPAHRARRVVMKRLLGYGLLGVLAFVLFLLVLAPATLVTDRLAERLPGFSAQTVEGLATEGSARGVQWRGVRIERLTWNWQALTLLTGWLEFRLYAEDPESQLTVSGNIAVDPGAPAAGATI